MKVHILFFGILSQISPNLDIDLQDCEDTDTLSQWLHQQFPSLAHQKYKMALNQKFVNENTHLSHGDTLALMPPFAGG